MGLIIISTTFKVLADEQSEQTLAIAQSFLKAAGSGDMDTLSELMADDFVWHNEGDSDIP